MNIEYLLSITGKLFVIVAVLLLIIDLIKVKAKKFIIQQTYNEYIEQNNVKISKKQKRIFLNELYGLFIDYKEIIFPGPYNDNSQEELKRRVNYHLNTKAK